MNLVTQVLTVIGVLCFASMQFGAQTSSAFASAQAHVGPSVWRGVYTDEQASRGESTYLAESCGTCHGEMLLGAEFGPPLVGNEFVEKWNEKTVGDLFDVIGQTMPSNNPGILTSRQTADLVAYVLRSNDFPSGEKALARDSLVLTGIKILQRSEP